jgi:creatinine amidohydrolase
VKQKIRYGDLTYLEIREKAKQGCLAVVPTGCTEQQGPHLPVDWDTWFAETLCAAAAERAREACGIESLVLPALPFGPTPEHRGYGSGYIDVSQDVHECMLEAILNSLADQGFRRIVVWRGCGGHQLQRGISRFNASRADGAKAFLPEQPYQSIWQECGDPKVPGGHADSFATSIALYLRPEAVRKERIHDPKSKPVDWSAPELDFTRYSTTGVIGDPTKSSAELGKTLWEACVDAVAEILRECV